MDLQADKKTVSTLYKLKYIEKKADIPTDALPVDIRRTYALQSIEEATVSSNQISGLNIATAASSSFTVADLHKLVNPYILPF